MPPISLVVASLNRSVAVKAIFIPFLHYWAMLNALLRPSRFELSAASVMVEGCMTTESPPFFVPLTSWDVIEQVGRACHAPQTDDRSPVPQKLSEQRRAELWGGDYDGMAAVERLCLDDIVWRASQPRQQQKLRAFERRWKTKLTD